MTYKTSVRRETLCVPRPRITCRRRRAKPRHWKAAAKVIRAENFRSVRSSPPQQQATVKMTYAMHSSWFFWENFSDFLEALMMYCITDAARNGMINTA